MTNSVAARALTFGAAFRELQRYLTEARYPEAKVLVDDLVALSTAGHVDCLSDAEAELLTRMRDLHDAFARG